jgi:hypothetical protein
MLPLCTRIMVRGKGFGVRPCIVHAHDAPCAWLFGPVSGLTAPVLPDGIQTRGNPSGSCRRVVHALSPTRMQAAAYSTGDPLGPAVRIGWDGGNANGRKT